MNQPLIDAYLDELLAPAAVDPHAAASMVPTHLVAVPAPAAAPAVLPSTPDPEPEAEPVRIPRLAVVPGPAHAPVAAAPVAAQAPPVSTCRAAAARPGRWLRVGVDRDRYAVELLRVQEVVRVMPVVAMRGAAASVLGVMNLRGRIVPVFDLGLWLGIGQVRPDERARIVVVERDDELIGVLVTAVHDVVTLTGEQIEPPVDAGTPGAIVGVARTGDVPTVLLDANGLFD